MALRHTANLHQYRGSRVITGPATEPVTAVELREHLRTNEGALSTSAAETHIAAARDYIERATGITMIDQTWMLALDRWPNAREGWWDGVRDGHIDSIHGANRGNVDLPRYPLDSITGMNVYDEAGNATAVTVANVFDIDTYRDPGRMTLKRGASWPVALRSNNAIEITYKAGYGETAADVPAPLRQAVLNLAAHLYAHRGDGCDMQDAYKSSGAAGLVDPFRVVEV